MSDIDKIIMVGGSTRIPAVQDAVKDFTGKELSKGLTQTKLLQWVLLFKREF